MIHLVKKTKYRTLGLFLFVSAAGVPGNIFADGEGGKPKSSSTVNETSSVSNEEGAKGIESYSQDQQKILMTLRDAVVVVDLQKVLEHIAAYEELRKAFEERIKEVERTLLAEKEALELQYRNLASAQGSLEPKYLEEQKTSLDKRAAALTTNASRWRAAAATAEQKVMEFLDDQMMAILKKTGKLLVMRSNSLVYNMFFEDVSDKVGRDLNQRIRSLKQFLPVFSGQANIKMKEKKKKGEK